MDKSEITKMPEGMSSEELDSFTTGEEVNETNTELAQEALEATGDELSPAEESVEDDDTDTTVEATKEEPAKEKPEADPKDAVIGDFRRKLRDEELRTAKLEGELEARKSMATTSEEKPKSPLELAEEKWLADPDNEDNLDGFAMTGDLYRKQKAFDDEQAATKSAGEQRTAADSEGERAESELQEGELSVEKVGKGLDLQSVASTGVKYLTRGDKLDIADIVKTRGSKAGLKEAYRRALQRTLESDGDDAKALKLAISTKKKSKSQAKPNKDGTIDIDALTTEGGDVNEGEAENDSHSKRITDFIFAD